MFGLSALPKTSSHGVLRGKPSRTYEVIALGPAFQGQRCLRQIIEDATRIENGAYIHVHNRPEGSNQGKVAESA